MRLAGTAQTLREAAEAFVDGMASGAIRTRAGERYKPSVVREYERSLRLHVLPTLGGAKLSKIQRRDVQRLADEMLAARRRPEHDPQRAEAAPGDLPARDRGRRPRRQPVRAAPAAGGPRPTRAHRRHRPRPPR